MGVDREVSFSESNAVGYMPGYLDLVKPVVVSATFGTLAGSLYSIAYFDITPHTLLVSVITLTALMAISRQSKRLARTARALIAVTATWMLADTVAHFGIPPYLVLPAVVPFYRYIAVAAAFIGGVFGYVMQEAFVLAASIVSLVDVVLVYKARLYFASMLRGGIDVLLADFGSYYLGFADLLWYSAAFAATKPAKAPLIAAAIYAGLVATARLAKKTGYAPALPLPLLLSALLVLLPIPQFFTHMFFMEVGVERRKIGVYSMCKTPQGLAFVGRWERGAAVELPDGRVHREVDYGWWSHCVWDPFNDSLYVFGYDAGAVRATPKGLLVHKAHGYLGVNNIATDGKLIYAVADKELYIFDRDLKMLNVVEANGLRDVAVADGMVYVLGARTLYVYDGKLRSIYKLSSDAFVGYFVQPHYDDIYVSTLTKLIRLDREFKERAFTTLLSRSFAVLDDYVVSVYDNVIATADRESLSLKERRYLSGITAGFAKMLVVDNKALTPAYLGDTTVVLSIS